MRCYGTGLITRYLLAWMLASEGTLLFSFNLISPIGAIFESLLRTALKCKENFDFAASEKVN